MALLTEKEVRAKFKEFLAETPGAAEVINDNDYEFYNWCSQYLDYQHIKNPYLLGNIIISPLLGTCLNCVQFIHAGCLPTTS